MSAVRFRQAGPEDAGVILQFICALADYEQMADQVVATEALLEYWLFEKQVAETLFVMEGKKEVGFAPQKMYNFSIAVKISKVKRHCASESINSWVCTNPVVSVKKLQATSLVVQWLRLHSWDPCKGPCSNAGQGTRSSMTQLRSGGAK